VRFARTELHATGDVLPRPHEHCYWLLPGRVLAGEHPGARGSLELMAQRLRTLQASGVGCFIDLTTPHDPLPAYTPGAGQRLGFPIGDFGIPSVATMRAALDAITAALDAGQGVYLHCRAGIGRTGTVAGCWLVEQGLEAGEALALLQRKFQAAEQSHSGRTTPETAAQRNFIAAWRSARLPAAKAP
jgi:atypical dual specificity phosphatase